MHNYGLAVDVSIADEKGNPLPMGTKVDHLGKEAHIDLSLIHILMALNGISLPPTSSTITKVHLKNCIVPILSSLLNSSIFALMTLFRVRCV